MNIYQNNNIIIEEVINKFVRLPRKLDFLL